MKLQTCISPLLILLFTSGQMSAQTNFLKMMSDLSTRSKVKMRAAVPPPLLRGDVDGNGTLTKNDVAELTKYLTQPTYTLSNPSAADMNADASVTVADLVALINELLHPSRGTLNGHEFVDLGLSVKWATCNLGAYSPEEFGDYYAWGDTETKESYSWATYCHMTEGENSSSGITKYQIKDGNTSAVWYNRGVFAGDRKNRLDDADDPANVIWGEGWRLPTTDEVNQLLNQCKWTYSSLDGVNGYYVEHDGNVIFLPLAGCLSGKIPSGKGNYGYYWTRNLTKSETSMSYSMYLNASGHTLGFDERFYGLSVRPVCSK